jgi:hypothetical protein
VRSLTTLTNTACGGARRLACQHFSASPAALTGMVFSLHCLRQRAAAAEGLKHSDSRLKDPEEKIGMQVHSSSVHAWAKKATNALALARGLTSLCLQA